MSAVFLIDRSRRIRRARLVYYSKDHPEYASARVLRRMEKTQAEQKDGLRREKGGIIGLLETRQREAGLETPISSAFVAMALIAVLATCAIYWADLLALPLAGLVGVGSGWLLYNSGYLGVLRARRVRAFNEALPDCLDMLARSLRSGQPIAVSLGVVAEHARGIAQEEFKRSCEELKLGVPLITALNGFAARVGTPEAHFVAIATGLQAETGGNLVETLENLAELLRERRKLRKKAAALSAEIRVSAVILSSLPFFVGATLFFMNPGYLAPMVTDFRGQIMAAAGIGSLILGIFSMFRLSRLDV